MKDAYKNINNIKTKLDNSDFISKCRILKKDFTRTRKVTPKDIILYELNKKGLSTKMEILNFNDINNIENISSQCLFKQREKLNPDAFIYLMHDSLREFYINYKKK